MSRTATQAELKAAHRALVRRHHPDLVAPAEREAATRRVQEINVAYGFVRDEAARAAYDRVAGTPGVALERLAETAGLWAGRWWARNRATTAGEQGVAHRAGHLWGRLTRGR